MNKEIIGKIVIKGTKEDLIKILNRLKIKHKDKTLIETIKDEYRRSEVILN